MGPNGGGLLVLAPIRPPPKHSDEKEIILHFLSDGSLHPAITAQGYLGHLTRKNPQISAGTELRYRIAKEFRCIPDEESRFSSWRKLGTNVSKIVERTLDFLELFAREKRPLSLSDISRILTIPVSSCHDVLQALQERGFIYEIAPRCGYYPTRRLYELGKSITQNDPVVLRADLQLRELRNAIDETILLAKITGMSATYLLTFEATHPLRFQLQPGDTIADLPVTSAGLALFGSLDESKLANALADVQLVSLTQNTPKTIEALRQLIKVGRDRGYYVNAEHSVEGLTTLSASFSWDQTLYIVTIAGPTARITTKMDAAAALLMDTCRRLAMKTGTSCD